MNKSKFERASDAYLSKFINKYGSGNLAALNGYKDGFTHGADYERERAEKLRKKLDDIAHTIDLSEWQNKAANKSIACFYAHKLILEALTDYAKGE